MFECVFIKIGCWIKFVLLFYVEVVIDVDKLIDLLIVEVIIVWCAL